MSTQQRRLNGEQQQTTKIYCFLWILDKHEHEMRITEPNGRYIFRLAENGKKQEKAMSSRVSLVVLVMKTSPTTFSWFARAEQHFVLIHIALVYREYTDVRITSLTFLNILLAWQRHNTTLLSSPLVCLEEERLWMEGWVDCGAEKQNDEEFCLVSYQN